MADKPDFLYFPSDERRQYRRIGGVLMTTMGLIALLAGYYVEDNLVLLVSFSMLLPGIFISGFRRETIIDCFNKELESVVGFHFMAKTRRFFNGDFHEVLIRKTVSTMDQRNDIGSSDTRRLSTSYAVLLKGQEEVVLDATADQTLARKWAEQVAAVFQLPLVEENLTEHSTDMNIQRIIGPAVLLAFLGLAVWIFLQAS